MGRFLIKSKLKIWDARTGQLLKELKDSTSNDITSAAISPDGRKIVASSWDGNIRVWDFENGKLLKIIGGHTNIVTFVSYRPDGNYLVSSSFDKTIKT